MSYFASTPPQGYSREWLEAELKRIQDALAGQQERLRLESKAVEPVRPRTGDVAYADGSNWNPSSQGEGLYWFDGGSWYRVASGPGVPLTDGDKGDVTVSGSGTTWTVDALPISRITGLQDDLDGKQNASGWPLDADGNYYVSLAYDAATRKVTVTALSGSTFDLYVRGEKITVSSPHVSAAHDAAADNYFYYHNGSAWVWSTDPWPFDEAPTCFVMWTGTDGVGYFELHSVSRDPNIHRLMHYSQGTQVQTRGAISGYTLATDSDAGVTFAIAETVLLDEDIRYALTALADGGPYTVWYRTTAGAWTFDEGNSLPFLYGTYPQWNDTATWTLVDTATNYYVNYFVFGVPALETQQQFIMIPGQQQHATLASAQAASVANLSFGDVPFQEIAPLYKITYGVKNSYGGTAKCRIESVETLIGSRASIAAAATASHNALSGIQGGTTAQYYHLTAEQYNGGIESMAYFLGD